MKRWLPVLLLAAGGALAARPGVPRYTLPADRKPGTPGYVLPWNREPSSWTADLAPRSEPGSRLIMSGHLLAVDEAPLPGVKIYFYQADSAGFYWRKGKERYVNRIGGVVRTNENGEYMIRTILPGQYEQTPHIHVDVWGRDSVEYITPVSLYPSPETMIPQWSRTLPTYRTEQGHYMGIVTLDSSGVYVCRHDLHLGWMNHASASYDSLLRALKERLEKPGR